VKPAQGQVDHVLARIRERVAAGERVLVTTLTKRMAEDLTQYFAELGNQMKTAVRRSDLQEAAILRDRIKELRAQQIYNSWVSRSPKWNRWRIGAFCSPPISRLGLGYLPDSPRSCTGVVSPAISRAPRG